MHDELRTLEIGDTGMLPASITVDDRGTRPQPNVGFHAPPAPIPPARKAEKVTAAVAALREAGALRSWYSDTDVRRLAETWLAPYKVGDGTWKRELPKLRAMWRGQSN